MRRGQIRLTNRPVGLMTWRGAHSWVMSGFNATADPAVTDKFTVTASGSRTSGGRGSRRSGVTRGHPDTL